MLARGIAISTAAAAVWLDHVERAGAVKVLSTFYMRFCSLNPQEEEKQKEGKGPAMLATERREEAAVDGQIEAAARKEGRKKISILHDDESNLRRQFRILCHFQRQQLHHQFSPPLDLTTFARKTRMSVMWGISSSEKS